MNIAVACGLIILVLLVIMLLAGVPIRERRYLREHSVSFQESQCSAFSPFHSLSWREIS